MKSNRSKACDISPEVKAIVAERDESCVTCGSKYAFPNAHYISRSKGGLGIEQNVVMLCPKCHMQYDQGNRIKREILRGMIGRHLHRYYPDFPDDERRYKK